MIEFEKALPGGQTATFVTLSPLQAPVQFGPPCWVGMEFDGTLANSQKRTIGTPWAIFGEPVPSMVAVAKQLRAAGVMVKLFTARAGDPDCLPLVEAWLEAAGLERLPITNTKDYDMICYYDDRAIQVIPDRGVTVVELLEQATSKRSDRANNRRRTRKLTTE